MTPAKASALEQIIQQLIADHDQVKNLFRDYQRLIDTEAPDAQREAVAAQICNALTVHAALEEEIFYPAAREVLPEDQEALIDHADIEHGSLKNLIAAIEASRADDGHYDARVHVLQEYVEHHVREEESDMFSELRQSTAGHDFAPVLQQLSQRRTELQQQLGETAPLQKPKKRATAVIEARTPARRPRQSKASARRQVTQKGSGKKAKST